MFRLRRKGAFEKDYLLFTILIITKKPKQLQRVMRKPYKKDKKRREKKPETAPEFLFCAYLCFGFANNMKGKKGHGEKTEAYSR